ncbi:MAG TPA: chemotaxis protein CheA, partial [Novosphingobium sp.]|nr:chemotaxis protein CheA [Novosphingobium sp.]
MSQNDPVAAFREEAADLLDQIEHALLDLSRNPADHALVNEVFRGLHTLKGSGAMFGFESLAAFTHHCETAFDHVRKGQATANQALIGVVLSARDHMQVLIDTGGKADAATEQAGEAILAALRQAVDEGGQDDVVPPSPARAAAGKGWRLHVKLPSGAMANGTNPLALLDELRDLGPCTVKARLGGLPPLDELMPTECYIAWDVEIEGDVSREAIEDVFIFVIDEMELNLAPLDEAVSPAPSAPQPAAPAAKPEAAPAPAQQAQTGKPAAPAQESVRVAAERLDELMNRVGELVIAQSRLAQLATSSGPVNELALRAVSEDIERLSAELRDTTMAMRMMPVGNLFGRFRRLVHDLARETGKVIELVTEGEATEVDKTVIELLADPMIHLIRNSCDHGLECAADRLASGKPATGRLTLSARQAGGEVLIAITDDGRGIDRERVRAKAEAQGLVQPGAPLCDPELLQLIFHPGFSTAATITNLSGRGVGMDVVKRSIEGLRGTIVITSQAGQGTTMTLHLPLTLAIIECMLVRVGDGRFAIPLSAVEECIEL